MAKKDNTQSPEKKASKKQTRKGLIPWIGLTVFACAWMFVLGILVGREMVPVRFDIEKLQTELAALKEAVIKKELDQYKIDLNSDNNKTEMKFYEALKNTDSEDKLKNGSIDHQIKFLPEKLVSSEETKAPVKNTVAPAQNTVAPAQKTVAPVKTSVAPAKKIASVQKEKTPDLKKPSQGGKKYTVQVASIRDPKDADRLVDRLKKQGYPAYRSLGLIPDKGIWYRVRVGYFKDRTEADSTLKRLKKEKIEAIVVER